ncbi:MAG: hypothetical protein AB7L65_02750 [Hyphomonadaceae bacterium]
MSEPTPSPFTWARFKEIVREACAVLGWPAAIAALGLIERRFADLTLQGLRGLEAIARRLLLADAAVLAPPPRRACKGRACKRPPAAPACGELGESAPRWRGVAFKLLAASARGRAQARYLPVPQPALVSARPLALRLEALLRVARNPAPYAMKLARRLARDADAPTRIAPPYREARPWFAAHVEDAGAAALLALARRQQTDSS